MDGHRAGGTAVSGESRDEGDGPAGKLVTCPTCDANTHAIVPKESRLVDYEDHADGKVWVNCLDCGDRFLVYYRTEPKDR